AFLLLRIFFFMIAALPVLLRLRLPKLATLLEPKNVPPPPEQALIQKIVSHVEAARGLERLLVRSRCLTRGITLYYFLRRAGLDVVLCFGMGNTGDEFIGHCWLLKNGEPFLETRDP